MSASLSGQDPSTLFASFLHVLLLSCFLSRLLSVRNARHALCSVDAFTDLRLLHIADQASRGIVLIKYRLIPGIYYCG